MNSPLFSLRAVGVSLLLIAAGTLFLLHPDWARTSVPGVLIGALVLIAASALLALRAWRQPGGRAARLTWAVIGGGFGLLLVLRLNDAPALSLYLLAVFLIAAGCVRLVLAVHGNRAARLPRDTHGERR